MIHIPYRDNPMNDVISGTVNFLFDASTTAVPQIKAGKVRALAISSAQRLSVLPETQTVAEGVPGFMGDSWTGVLVRKGTPEDIVQKLSSETIKILGNVSFQKRLQDVGLKTGIGSNIDFARFIANESATYSKVIRDNNIAAD
jgi:tripartite-type tricarboxylate transporter receptor subunit TctC